MECLFTLLLFYLLDRLQRLEVYANHKCKNFFIISIRKLFSFSFKYLHLVQSNYTQKVVYDNICHYNIKYLISS